jgi:uncharacterized damage-inducible protein DinB
MDLASQLRLQARANRLANHRLFKGVTSLSREEFHAPRTSYFPSLAATLNHVLAVDQYYVGALHGDAGLPTRFAAFVPAFEPGALAARQRDSDERLIAFCDRLDAAGCEAEVLMERRDGVVQRDRAAHVLAHLFMHQTHHRGQAHAMLAGTGVPPPQLDEFLMPSDAMLRQQDMRELGWFELEVYRS